MATPEPLWVEPVVSPTDLLTQTIVVNIGNGELVTVMTVSGIFSVTGSFGAAGNPALVDIALLPGVVHDLTVSGRVRASTMGGCPFGGYTLTTQQDRNGGATPTPAATWTETRACTITPTPTATTPATAQRTWPDKRSLPD